MARPDTTITVGPLHPQPTPSRHIKFRRGLKSAAKWVFTWKGFLITIYGVNVVAWGGMLFLLLVKAGMCPKEGDKCDRIDSPRRKWIEIDSQILNALFCVPAFGLIPWRFRDLFLLVMWRLRRNGASQHAMRRLAGIHNDWFRLKGSDEVTAPPGLHDEENPAFPLPTSQAPPVQTTTGKRASPTSTWKMDFVVWCMAFNTFFQAVLCGFMWGYTR
jgi:DUF2985 family protein